VLPEPFAGWFGALQGALFQALVLPLLQFAGLTMYTEDAFNATEDLLWGVVEVALLVAILLPLERRFPVERFVRGPAVRTDVIYTLIHRLGVFPLFFFFTLRPLFDALQAALHLKGVPTPNLESLLPALAAAPVASFLVYLVLLDLTQYLIHRGQHAFGWWWALHAVHHSQRQMTFWTDNRNHLLDSLLTDSILALVALAIGVPPAQFALLIVLPRLLESLAHANLRLSFGTVGDRLLVSPRYHRLHHAIAASPHGDYRGANYAVLFPLWDLLFGTAAFRGDPGPTGIDDQLAGRDYGEGFWAQQWLGLKRLAGRG
jgi:sterol desaturase/sphingolipid hydroxylase (fatty acid hydroxylase superfamily)